jgi:hypothetical protein
VVGVTDPYGRILGFLDRSRYFFFQVAPELYLSGHRSRPTTSQKIEPGPLDMQPETLRTRPQRRSHYTHTFR